MNRAPSTVQEGPMTRTTRILKRGGALGVRRCEVTTVADGARNIVSMARQPLLFTDDSTV